MKYFLIFIIFFHLQCGVTAPFRVDNKEGNISIISLYNYNEDAVQENINLHKFKLTYKLYSNMFSGDNQIEVDSTNLCPPYRKLYITIERPKWFSFLSFMTLTIPFRHTVFILSCN